MSRRPRLLLTRPAAQAGELAALLADVRVDAIHVPTVAIEPPGSGERLDAALRALSGDDWLVITSANGAAVVLDRLRAGAWQRHPSTRIAAVGPTTAGVLRDGGLPVHHVPDRYLTVAVAEGLGPIAGRRVLLARADAATPDLPRALSQRGARVDEVIAYHTVEGPASSSQALADVLRDRLDGVTFTSASTARGLALLAERLPVHLAERARRLPALCIGPVTARAATDAGFAVAVVAAEYTARGLAEAAAGYFATRSLEEPVP